MKVRREAKISGGLEKGVSVQFGQVGFEKRFAVLNTCE